MLSANVGQQMASIINDLERRVKRLETLEIRSGIGCMFLIEDILLSTNQVTISFTGIPSGYKHLLLVLSLRSIDAQYDNGGVFARNPIMRFNGSSAAVYDWYYASHSEDGIITDVETFSDTGFNISAIPCGNSPSLAYSSSQIFIQDYLNTGKGKSWNEHSFALHRAVTGNMNVTSAGGTWRNTEAVSQIDLTDTGIFYVGFVVGSRASLYGLC